MTLGFLQTMIAAMAARCGFANEPPLVLLAKLTEELGELARAVCEREGIARAPDTAHASLPDELADGLILLFRLADAYRVDVAEAIQAKVTANEQRYGQPCEVR